jgi:four helix bundle protein
MIKDVTDLKVYTESLRLLKLLYILLNKIPKAEYALVVQCKKCGNSIPANIAEGYAKRSYELEFKRFLKISLGSSDELVSHMRVFGIVFPELNDEAGQLAEEYKVLSKRLNSLHKNWHWS